MEKEVTPGIYDSLSDTLQAAFASEETVLELALAKDYAPRAMELLSRHYTSLEDSHCVEELKNVLTWCATQGQQLDQNRRDCTVNIVDVIATGTTQIAHDTSLRADIVEVYAEAVEKLDPSEDYFGTPYTLYEIGETLARNFGDAVTQAEAYQAHMRIRSSWSRYFTALTNEEDKIIGKGLIESLVPKFFPTPEVDAADQWEHARKHPEFESKQAQELHDFYMCEVQQKGTFKPHLWRVSSEFRMSAAEVGVDIADYWNLSDTGHIPGSLAELMRNDKFKTVQPRLALAIEKQCGVTVEELLSDPNLARAFADEITSTVSAFSTRDLLSRVEKGDVLLDKLTAQVDAAVDARNPRKKLAPINKFLAGIALEPQSDPESAVAYMRREDVVRAISKHIDVKNTDMLAMSKALSELFPPHGYNNLVFMHRGEYDMFSGDDSRDCTAYHLMNGFNAWTLPYWVSNPAFVMSYVTLADKRIAKMGIVLAQDEENRPRIVVDSIETYKNINPEQTDVALSAIQNSIRELQQWADKRGFGDVMFCTLTNSSELSVELPIADNPQPPETLRLFGGPMALDAVYASIPEGARTAERVDTLGYWQSAVNAEANGDPGDALPQDISYDVQAIETILASTHSNAVYQAAAEGNVGGVLAAYIEAKSPHVARLYGTDPAFYEAMFEAIDHEAVDEQAHDVIEAIVAAQRDEIFTIEDVMLGTESASSAVYDIQRYRKNAARALRSVNFLHELPVRDIKVLTHDYKTLKIEASKLDRLLCHLKKIEHYTSVETVITRIFGNQQAASGDNDQARDGQLRTTLPIVNRKIFETFVSRQG